jgi:signal peptidase
MPKVIKEIIFWVFYIAILVGLVYSIPKGLAYVLKTEYPMASITSGSMWPALKKGDFILIKGVHSQSEIKVGDIIVYKNPKGFTIHRIVNIKDDMVTTRGDANNVDDAPINFADIIGKPIYFRNKPLRIPLLGMISVYLNKDKT